LGIVTGTSETAFTQSAIRRTMTIEAYQDAPLPDRLFQQVNPAKIDAYRAAVARELDGSPD
jgi:hypothetical protein